MPSARPTWRRSPPRAASAPTPRSRRPSCGGLPQRSPGGMARASCRCASSVPAPCHARSTLPFPLLCAAPCRSRARSAGGWSPAPAPGSNTRPRSRPARFARSPCTARVARSPPSPRPRPRWDGPTCGAARAEPMAGSTARASSTSPTPRPATPWPGVPRRPTCGGSPHPSRPARSHPPTSSSSAPAPARRITSACTWVTAWWWSRRTPMRGCASSRSPPGAGTGSAG